MQEHIGKQILAYAQIENIPIHDIDLVHMKLTPTQWVMMTNSQDMLYFVK